MTSGSIDGRCGAVMSSTSAPCAASVRPTYRAGDDARQIEYLQAGKRTLRRDERVWRRVADFLDGEQRQLGDRLALRVAIPFSERAACSDDEACFGGRSFERLGGHAVERPLDGGFVVRHAEELEQSAAMMRQIGVQPCPAAVAAAVKPGEVVVIFVIRFAVDAQITLAAKFDRRRAHIDADALPAAATQPPDLGRRERRSPDRRLGRRPDRKGRRQDRLSASEENVIQARSIETRAPPQAGKHIHGIWNEADVRSGHDSRPAFRRPGIG